MDDDVYDQREGTYRWYKRKEAELKQARIDAGLEEPDPEPVEEDESVVEGFEVGMRCETDVGNRGEVTYVGKTDFASGYWIGIRYDEPVGKNDGSVKGKQYFEAMDKYGGFLKPDRVKVGDYPEVNDWDLDSDDELDSDGDEGKVPEEASDDEL
eukprot:TRINITY_DN2731_c0_g1_i1.p1 TRINITY_DN2731_c0_g1~~TRINITY_DN2731_c0_g1_i1.p1  ORF type:complete len:154 (+),score=68.75 TRINITY_DN2731_c0_g1_i1:243-704(+)